ncbi:hypothetical protein Taro_053836 [Colocasia esculenta]|uniref:Retrotransposon gag domain-containing protein n=1 Tax=Colocasia esculenta TaxID=4460 RepID=A0A843XM01_COLES|nr:hypothetical protein [Colocasia esculenta]
MRITTRPAPDPLRFGGIRPIRPAMTNHDFSRIFKKFSRTSEGVVAALTAYASCQIRDQLNGHDLGHTLAEGPPSLLTLGSKHLSRKSLRMAEYEDMGYHEDVYNEMYDSVEPTAQLPYEPHIDPSTSQVHAVDSQSPHLSSRHVTANAPTSIDLSQLVDLLQNLQPSQLQEVQAALKGKSILESIQSLRPNMGVFYEPARDPTVRASPAPSLANSIIHSRPHNPVGRPSLVRPSLSTARPIYPSWALAHTSTPASAPPRYHSVQVSAPQPHPSGVPPKPSLDQLTQALLTKVSRLEQDIKKVSTPKDSFELALPSMPVFHLPPSELPVNCRYSGSGNPFVHIKEFMYESSFWQNDNRALAFLFRRSLDGLTLEWFYSLKPADAEDFEAKMKADKDFLHYADRWRALTERLRDPLSESEQVKMITTNATPQFRHILAMNKLSTMEELYERACYIQTQLKDSPIMAMFEPKARTLKKNNGTPPTGGPTTEGVLQHEKVSAMGNPSSSTYHPNPNPRPQQP